MNLLLLTSAMDCGGAETHVLTLAVELKKRGHAVTVVSSGGRMTRQLAAHAIPHVTLPLHSCRPWHLLAAYRGLMRLLRRQPTDLLHAHSRTASLVASAAAKRAHLPLVTTAHAHFRADPLRRRFSRWGACTVAVSQDLKQELCESYGVAAHRIHVIPNGIAMPPDSPSPTPPSDRHRLIFCSRLDLDCANVAFLLCDIMPALRQHFPTVELLIIGGGNALPALRRRAVGINRETGIDLIRLTGSVEDPTALFATACGVVGVSRVALEAMSMGIPVILAGNEGFLGLADEHTLPLAEDTNLCCRGEAAVTARTLYDACATLLSMSEEEWQARSRMLATYVRRSHTVQRTAAQTEDVYRQALRDQPCRAPAHTVLCGYYGYGNTGDEALLCAAVARTRERFPDQTVSALTKGGKADQGTYGVRCVRRTDPFAVTRELKNARRLVLGGGTLLQDATSLRSLCYYCALLAYAKKKGATVELWANGLQEPITARGRRLLRQALARCDVIGVRDRLSQAVARDLLSASASTLKLEPDLAFPTAPAPPDRIAYLLRRYRIHAPFALIVPMGGSGYGSEKLLCEWLCALRADGVQTVFVPFYPKEDRALCHRLAATEEDRILPPLSPADLTGIMAHSEVVCGMRLHSLVFAASAHTPFVGFGTDPKIEAFCHEHGGVYVTDLYAKSRRAPSP